MHEKATKQPGLGLLNTLNRLQQVCKKSPLQSLSDTAHLLAILILLDQMTSLDMTRLWPWLSSSCTSVTAEH
ncbi:hypothetical protein DPMN_144020 [Dreissena polymorpha]|uniref:Uncharacterized protein n=1 Tax=Dreissena polymorpha TaxID=45954 RepID=A0A9D4JPU5_DREPO|nr:hypothetical protein DPMN_144020 [Dreissena polymorpha]